MPYSINWYIENEIIYSNYSGIVTPDELRACLTAVKEMVESSPRPLVHIISDLGDIEQGVPLKESIHIVRDVGGHSRSGWMLSIREKSVLMKMGSAMGSSLFKLRYRAFSTLEEAEVHLKSMDQALSWDKVNKSLVENLRS